MKILAFESSCDETAVAVVEDGRTVLSDAIASQADLHALYGGVGDFFGVVGQVAQRQVGVFHDRAGLVNDLHGSKPPFSGHAPPDVHIVGGRLHCGAAAVDWIREGSIKFNIVRRT